MANKDKDIVNKLKDIKIKNIGIEKLVLLLLVGIFLIVVSIPTSKNKATTNETSTESNTSQDNEDYAKIMEEELEDALKSVEGVGNVQVMITLKGSKEVVVNKDTPYEQSNVVEEDSSGGTRENITTSNQEQTVLITKDGDNIPYVIKELEPEIEGIVIIAEGGDKPSVVQNISKAAQVLFGVSAYKVQVLKMENR